MELDELKAEAGSLAEDVRETAGKGTTSLNTIDTLHNLRLNQEARLGEVADLLGKIATLTTDIRNASEAIGVKRNRVLGLAKAVAADLEKRSGAAKSVLEGSTNPKAEEITTNLEAAHTLTSTSSEVLVNAYQQENPVIRPRLLDMRESGAHARAREVQRHIDDVKGWDATTLRGREYMETSVTHTNNAADSLDEYAEEL